MTPDPNSSTSPAASRARRLSFPARTIVLSLELALVAGLLLAWLLSEAVRSSRSLWILFLYCFPSEFLVAPVPHEPVLFYFGQFYPPLTVALVSVAGTVLTEALNYHAFSYFSDLKVFDRVHQSGLTRRLVDLFNRAPFLALVLGGLSPVPFYPLRFLVVLARYPLPLYLLAVLVSRTPRFFVLALLGQAFRIPGWLLLVVFGALILAANVPFVLGLIRRRRGAGGGSPG